MLIPEGSFLGKDGTHASQLFLAKQRPTRGWEIVISRKKKGAYKARKPREGPKHIRSLPQPLQELENDVGGMHTKFLIANAMSNASLQDCRHCCSHLPEMEVFDLIKCLGGPTPLSRHNTC